MLDKEIKELLNKIILEQGVDDPLVQQLIDDQAKILLHNPASLIPSLDKKQDLISRLNRNIAYSTLLKWVLPGICLLILFVSVSLKINEYPKDIVIDSDRINISGNFNSINEKNITLEKDLVKVYSDVHEKQDVYKTTKEPSFNAGPIQVIKQIKKSFAIRPQTANLEFINNPVPDKTIEEGFGTDSEELYDLSKDYYEQFNDTVKIQIEIKGLGRPVNSEYADFAPVVSADGTILLFTSRRPVTQKEIQKKKESMEGIYISQINPKTKKWQKPKLLEETVNQKGRHNSAIAISNDGQRMLLYRDDIKGNGDIFESYLEGKFWSEAVKLPEPINSVDHESSASISPDGKTIFFCSNRKGGIGGKDIWLCRLDQNGNWGEAENLGPTINTKEDEEGIFIHPDGKTIYFSSKGHKSMGGYDIFKSVWTEVPGEQAYWSKPENLGEPINTKDDDVYFTLTADGKTGYYASSKQGGIGEKDIYAISFIKSESDGPKLTLFKGVVIDKITSIPLGSEIEIVDNEKNKIVTQFKSNSNSGEFLVSLPSGKNYGINVKRNGYLFYSDNLIVPEDAAYKELIKTVPLEKLEIGSKIILKNIFYDFDKSTLRKESVMELERLVMLMNDNPAMQIELSSHTDSKGTDDYNNKLSQARAQSVVDFLINKGIDIDRLVPKGYGESEPIDTNETDEGRQMNRRTEFKILKM